MLLRLIAVSIAFASPALAAETPTAVENTPVAASPAADTGYATFDLKGGCLWRLPPMSGNNTDAFAAITVMQDSASIQLTGATKDDKGEMSAATFSKLRMTAGKAVDTSALGMPAEDGPTARIAIPHDKARSMVEALALNGGEIEFVVGQGKKQTHTLAKPSTDEMARMIICVDKMDAPVAGEAPKAGNGKPQE